MLPLALQECAVLDFNVEKLSIYWEYKLPFTNEKYLLKPLPSLFSCEGISPYLYSNSLYCSINKIEQSLAECSLSHR